MTVQHIIIKKLRLKKEQIEKTVQNVVQHQMQNVKHAMKAYLSNNSALKLAHKQKDVKNSSQLKYNPLKIQKVRKK